MTARNDMLAEVKVRAREPVRVEWRSPLLGFLAGFAVALLPALALAPVFGGRAGALVALGVATCLGLAAAVCAAAAGERRT